MFKFVKSFGVHIFPWWKKSNNLQHYIVTYVAPLYVHHDSPQLALSWAVHYSANNKILIKYRAKNNSRPSTKIGHFWTLLKIFSHTLSKFHALDAWMANNFVDGQTLAQAFSHLSMYFQLLILSSEILYRYSVKFDGETLTNCTLAYNGKILMNVVNSSKIFTVNRILVSRSQTAFSVFSATTNKKRKKAVWLRETSTI